MASFVAGFVEDVAWLMKNAALRKDVPVFSWATVITGSPSVTVMIDGTTTQRQVSANAAGRCVAGDRVRVEIQGTRVTVLANPSGASGARVVSGRASAPIATGNTITSTVTVPFPAGFTTPPRVTASLIGTVAGGWWNIQSVTAAAFEFRVGIPSAAGSDFNLSIDWIAVQT